MQSKQKNLSEDEIDELYNLLDEFEKEKNQIIKQNEALIETLNRQKKENEKRVSMTAEQHSEYEHLKQITSQLE